jgi:hypothetical protein
MGMRWRMLAVKREAASLGQFIACPLFLNIGNEA